MTKTQILKTVKDKTGLNLKNPTRKREYAEARYIYFYLCREYATDGKSLEKIGSTVNKDHSTVLHGLRYCKDQLDVSKEFKYLYRDIEQVVLKKVKTISRFPKSDKAVERIMYLEDQTRLILDLQKDYKREIKRLQNRIDNLKYGGR